MAEVIPAILTSDSEEFKAQIKAAEEFGADTVQVDFTDGKFVESKTLLPDELDAFVLSDTNLTLEAHLMVEKPEQYFAILYTLGFRRIAVHLESLDDPHRIIREIREYGMELGFAINPSTKFVDLEPHLTNLDFVLFLTVAPGEQGRPFESEVVQSIQDAHQNHPDLMIEVDGGIKADTIKQVHEAGVQRIVVGSGIWKADDPSVAYKELGELIK